MKKDSISIKDMEPFFLYLPTDGGWNFCTVMEWYTKNRGKAGEEGYGKVQEIS